MDKIINKLKITGVILIMLSVLFAITETVYFGSNYFPQTKAELLCDFLSAFILGIGAGMEVVATVLYLKY